MVVLRGMTWEHERGHGSMLAAADEYARTHPHVSVVWERRSLQAFADAPVEVLAQRFDLLVIDHPHIPLAVERGALAALDGTGHDDALAALRAYSVGPSHESYHHEGRQYGLASDAAAQVAVRRPDLLAAAPADWEEVVALAREGRVLWPLTPIDAYSSLLTLAANSGTPAFAREGSFLERDDALRVLALLHDLAARVPEWCLRANPIDIAEAMTSDDRWLYCPLAFGYTNYSRAGYRRARLACTDIPEGPEGTRGSLLGGAGIAVSASTPHLREAVDYAFWVASAGPQRGAYFDGGGQPGNARAWDDDRLNAATLDFFRNTRATLEGAWVRPRTASYVSFQDEVSPWVTAALAGELADDVLVDRLETAAARRAEVRT